jgi:hypothetical protein
MKTPFSFQALEGWDRDAALRVIDLAASGRFRAIDTGSTRDLSFTYGTDVAIQISKSLLPVGTDEGGAVVAITRLLEAALGRTDDEHVERMHISCRAHDAAARLEAPDDLPTRKMNTSAATPAREAVFGTGQFIPGGWSVRPIPTPDRAGLPSIVSMYAFDGGFQFDRLDTRVHDVEPLDPMSRLRLEAHYADLMTRIASIEAIAA